MNEKKLQDLQEWFLKNIIIREEKFPIWNKEKLKWDVRRTPIHHQLTAHLKGFATIGNYQLALNNTCKYTLIDIDAHNEESDPEQNLEDALSLYQICSQLGLSPILEDSNGAGGYHLWILWKKPVDAAKAKSFGEWLVADFETDHEVFPKQGKLKRKLCGNQTRLMGKHHKRDHWSKIWDGHKWAEWDQATDYLLTFSGNDVSILSEERFSVTTIETEESNYEPIEIANQSEAAAYVIDLARSIINAAKPEGSQRFDSRRKAGIMLGAAVCSGWLTESEAYDSVLNTVCCNTNDEASALDNLDNSIAYGIEIGEPFKMDETKFKEFCMKRKASVLYDNPETFVKPIVGGSVVPIKSVSRAIEPAEPADEVTTTGNQKKSVSEKLFELAFSLGEVWHSGELCYITIDEKKTLEINQIGDLLRQNFYDKYKKIPTGSGVSDAIAQLQAEAIRGKIYQAYTRVARVENTIYVDLGNENWNCVEINANGWKIIDKPPVRFIRGQNLGEIPMPVDGDINTLREYCNMTDEDFLLLLAFIFDAYNPETDFFCGVLGGEQGSAKSTTLTMIRNLVDPVIMVNTERCNPPVDERNVAIEASDSYLVTYDNLSKMPAWLSDALCKISTGGGFKIRKHYSNNQSQIFGYKRPAIINGIEDFVTRGDLASRSLMIELLPIPKTENIEGPEFWRDFNKIKPEIIGAIFSALSGGLRSNEKYDYKPRMAASYTWCGRCLSSLGIDAEKWKSAFTRSEQKGYTVSHDSSVIIELLETVIKNNHLNEKTIRLTTSNLLKELRDVGSQEGVNLHIQSKQQLTNTLKRLAPILRDSGIDASKYHTKTENGWVFKFIES